MKISKEFRSKWFYLIVPGIIGTAIWEMGKALVKGIAASGNSVMKYFVDLPYKIAPFASTDMLLLVAFILFCVGPLFLGGKTLVKNIQLYSLAKRIDGNVLTQNEAIEESPPTPARKEEKPNFSRKLRENIRQLLLNMVIVLLACIYTYQAMVYPIVLNMGFSHTMDIIAPYVEQDTALMLKSDWARMDSKEDFDKLNATMLQIREANNLIDK